MMLDPVDVGYEWPGGNLQVVCYPCFLYNDGAQLETDEYMKQTMRVLEAQSKQWEDIPFNKCFKLCQRSWERRKAVLEDKYRRKNFTNLKQWMEAIEELAPIHERDVHHRQRD